MPVRRGARAVPQLPLLTLGLMGGQCVWSTEMAFAGPFLLHLGMSKSHMSAVFVAGPLSGLLVQPSIGLISDASTSRWGRRRPLLLLSTTICAFSLLQLGFARPMASIISSDADTQTTATTALAVLSIFTIDFSVNAVQALDRALLIDLVPMHLQAAANAWCARLAGVGAIIGFLIGQTDLTDLAPFRWVPSLTAVAPGEGDATEAQLRCISMLVAFLLLVTQAVTMAVAKEQPVWQEEERDTQMTADSTKGNNRHCCASLQGVMSMFSDLIATGRSMSRPMIDLLRIQLFLSSAWYPVLFYSTTWVAQIALHTSSITPASAMRLGSLAMLIHAILSIVCTLVLPPVLAHFAHGNRCGRKYDALTLSWSLSTFLLSFALFCTWWASKVNSMHSSVAIIALTGLPWAFSAWVPFTLLGILIRKEVDQRQDAPGVMLSSLNVETDLDHRTRGVRPAARFNRREEEVQSLMRHHVNEDGDEEASETDEVTEHHQMMRGLSETLAEVRHDHESIVLESDPVMGATLLGLYNVSIVIPQFMMTLLSTILFAIIEPGVEKTINEKDRSTESPPERLGADHGDAVGVVLRTGGVFAFIAAALILRMARQHAALLSS